MATRPFKRQIILTYVVGFFLLISLFVTYLVWAERNYLFNNSNLHASALAQSMAVSSLSWVLANDVAGLEEIVQALKPYPELHYAMVLSEKGRVLAHTDQTKRGQYLTDKDSKTLINSTPQNRILADNRSMIDVAVPILLKNRHVGWARVGLGREQIAEKLNTMVWGSMIFVGAALCFSLLEAFAIGKRLSRRISALAEVTAMIQSGERDVRADVQGTDEITRLAHAFNDMLDTLATSENRFRALFEQAAVGVAQVDANTGRFVRVNQRFCDICGYGLAEMMNKTLHDITHPDDIQASHEHMHVLMEGKAREYSMEKRFSRKDGTIVWVHLTVSAMWSFGETPTHHIAVVQDITPRVQAQEELLRLNLDLEQLVQKESLKNREKDLLLIQQSRLAAMGEMVHNIAHQWRQPLNALSIIIANIKDDYDYGELTAESLQESVNKSRRLLRRMSTTVDEFRDFFRPDKESCDFALDHAVDEAIFIIGDTLVNNGIQLEKKLEAGLVGHGYPNQLAQAILNLLVNSKDAILERKVSSGKIAICLGKSGSQAILTVQDNARGIDEEVLPKIFDPYYTTKEQGSGIGLYMTKMIMERNMKGSIIAVNHGEGTLITLAIPLIVA